MIFFAIVRPRGWEFPRALVLKKFKYRSLLRAGHLLNLRFVTTILNE